MSADSFEANEGERFLKEKYPKFETIFLVASRLTREKNIPAAIRAFAGSNPKAGLVIIGDGPERNKLEAISSSLGLSQRILFEPWQGNLSRYFGSADAFLLPSLYEGYGLTLIEAKASHSGLRRRHSQGGGG
jgi:glycosyltransferase involved in cell wall biosynthesis